jgi:hypothetical protein
MNRLNLLFFALLISYIHNFYSEFNEIFLQSFFFLFLFEFIIVKLFNRFRRNQTNHQNQTNDDDDSSVSDIEDEQTEDKLDTDNKCEEKIETDNKEDKETEEKTIEEQDKVIKEDDSEETEEESDSESKNSSDEPVDIAEGVDVSQMEILRLLNNYESLGDSGLMELKKKMLELDKLVEFYKNDTKKAKKE